MADDTATLLAAHAALPEAYQPAWGLDASRGIARRACDDRLAVLLPLLEALPGEGPLRVLDIGCAQGYFTLAIAHALRARGREVEVLGIDYLDANVRFCQALAAHHGLPARFRCERFDAGFFQRNAEEPWDVALALNVLHHVQYLGDSAQAAVAAIRAHARVALCELAQVEEALDWMRDAPGAAGQLLGGYAFRRRLADFPTHLTDVPRPLYACSDSLAWVGDRWFAFDRVADRSHAGVPDAFAGERRFLFGADTVVKAYRGKGPFGAFNRAELDAEAMVLAKLADEPGRYPKVLARADDDEHVWLARGLLPGRLLSEYLDAGEAFDRDGVVRGLLGELAHLEARGWHHGDLRCWNLLLHDGQVRLIDYGAMTATASPLQRVALAAVLLEIAEGKLRHAQPFYASLQPLTAYPAGWHKLLCYLLQTPQPAFRYATALAALDAPPAQAQSLVPAADVVAAVAREQCEGFQRLEAHLEATARRLADVERELRAAARERETLDGARQQAATHAQSLETALADARAYADALQARIARENADAATERAALDAARQESEAYAKSLQGALAESHACAASLRGEIEHLKVVADRERAGLTARLSELQARHARLQRRFRLLKFAWPREPGTPKEVE